MSDNEDFIESSFFEEKLDLYSLDELPKEAYQEDKVCRTINIRITLEDKNTLGYSVVCPEWKYSMPSYAPHETVKQFIKCVMKHNIDVIRKSD